MSDATQHTRGTCTSTVRATPTPTLAQRITPGPWAVSMPSGQTAFNGRRVTVTHNGSMIADLDWNSPAANMANAELIALAPTLLAQLETERALVEEASRTIAELHKQVSELRAALKLCVARLEEYGDAEGGTALEGARAAISLAGGGSK